MISGIHCNKAFKRHYNFGGFAHRILHNINGYMYCNTMSLQAVYPHFCSIIFGFGVYPVYNLLL